MDKQDLYELDEITYKQIQDERKKTEAEYKFFYDGMEKGAELMMKAVRDYLDKEEKEKANG